MLRPEVKQKMIRVLDRNITRLTHLCGKVAKVERHQEIRGSTLSRSIDMLILGVTPGVTGDTFMSYDLRSRKGPQHGPKASGYLVGFYAEFVDQGAFDLIEYLFRPARLKKVMLCQSQQ